MARTAESRTGMPTRPVGATGIGSLGLSKANTVTLAAITWHADHGPRAGMNAADAGLALPIASFDTERPRDLAASEPDGQLRRRLHQPERD